MNIEVKATFKNTNIKENGTVMQFELSPFFMGELPNIAKLTGSVVYLTLATEQEELPLEEDAEDVEEREALPLEEEPEEIEDVEYEFVGEEMEAPELVEGEPLALGDGCELLEEAEDEEQED